MSRFSRAANTHQHFEILRRWPSLLRLMHVLIGAATLRAWYVRRALSRLLAAPDAPDAVLDAGCGNGDFLLPAARRYPGRRFYGIDRAPDQVDVVRHYARTRHLGNVHVATADVATYRPPEPVDLVLCITVLQYVAQDRQALARFYESLAPGGRLLLYVPVDRRRRLPGYTRFIHRAFRAESYDLVQQPPRHYDAAQIIEKVTEAGFEICETTYAYGPVGQVYYEAYSLFTMTLLKYWWLFPVLLPLFFLVLFPVFAVLMAVDFLRHNREGNGLLLLAQKPARQSTPSSGLDAPDL